MAECSEPDASWMHTDNNGKRKGLCRASLLIRQPLEMDFFFFQLVFKVKKMYFVVQCWDFSTLKNEKNCYFKGQSSRRC